MVLHEDQKYSDYVQIWTYSSTVTSEGHHMNFIQFKNFKSELSLNSLEPFGKAPQSRRNDFLFERTVFPNTPTKMEFKRITRKVFEGKEGAIRSLNKTMDASRRRNNYRSVKRRDEK